MLFPKLHNRSIFDVNLINLTYKEKIILSQKGFADCQKEFCNRTGLTWKECLEEIIKLENNNYFPYGNDFYLNNNENEPSIICSTGNRYYYKDNLLHREDGPSVIYWNGDQMWYLQGKRH